MPLKSSEPQSELGAFLKTLRQRIEPESRTLGPYERPLTRSGRRVTQEEIAEAVGVSRGWYKLLETGANVRASTQLLERLAQALTLTDDERTTLFTLAVPEMRNMQIRADSRAILEAFSWVRSATRQLWAASSDTDAYSELSERIADWFDDALLVHWMRRDEAGTWERQRTINRGLKGCTEIFNEIATSLNPRSMDNYMLYPELSEPGAVGGTDDLSPRTQRTRINVYSKYACAAPEFIHGRVRSRGGLIGGFSVMHEHGRPYSETERAVLGAVAELTSLALS